eukprot:scaffold87_cov388-Prasinococcus_capsulatus_cf.AAC.13
MSNAPNWATAERTRQLADASGGVTGSPPVRCVKASRSIRQNVLSPATSMHRPLAAWLHRLAMECEETLTVRTTASGFEHEEPSVCQTARDE